MKAEAQAQARSDPAEDVDMSQQESGNKDNEIPEVEWIEVQRARDRHFKLFVQSELLHGGQDKSEELRTLVWDQQVNIVEGPRYTKHNSMTGYSLSVETQEELELLLGVGAKISDEDGNETQVLMFQRMDNTKKEEEFERTVEVYGLPPRIHPDRIKSALIKYGEVERINVLPCAKGMKMKAAVVFKGMEAVDLIRKVKLQYILIGKDFARIYRIGQERIKWEESFVAKLTCLPFGTTPADLKDLLSSNMATFITVPWVPTRDGNNIRRLREAYVHFSSEEMRDSAIEKQIRVGKQVAQWATLDEKKCYQCGETGHIIRECEERKKRMETRAHMRMVNRFQNGGQIRMIHGSWAAAAAAGLGHKLQGQQTQKQNDSIGQNNNSQGQQTQGQEQKQTSKLNQGQQTAVNNNAKSGQEMEQRIIRMEKKFEEAYSKMMDALEAEKARGDLLLKMVVKMVSSGLGGCIETNELEAAGLSGDQIRNSQQKDRRGKNAFIPLSNVSLAGIHKTISERNQTKNPHELPLNPKYNNLGQTTSNNHNE